MTNEQESLGGVKGNRQMNSEELVDVNALKDLESQALDLITKIGSRGTADPRWLAMAKTDIEVGCMKAVRAIAVGNQ